MTVAIHHARHSAPAAFAATLVGAVLFIVGVSTASADTTDDGLSACIKSGSIRVLSETETCKENEVPVTLSTGGAEAVTSEQIVDGTITGIDLDDTFEGTFLTTSSELPWDQLTGVPGDLADGGVARDLECNGCLTSADLADNSVGNTAIAAGAVTADKADANAAVSSVGSTVLGMSSGTPQSERDAGFAVLTPSGSGGVAHAALVTAQFQAGCSNDLCPQAGEVIHVEWWLSNGSGAVSQVYSDVITATDRTFVGAVSALVTDAEEGTPTAYTLRVRGSAESPLTGIRNVSVTNAIVSAVDLGRS